MPIPGCHPNVKHPAVDVALTRWRRLPSGLNGLGPARELRGQPLDRLALPGRDHRLMDGMLGGQFRKRLLALDRIQRNLGLEVSPVTLPCHLAMLSRLSIKGEMNPKRRIEWRTMLSALSCPRCGARTRSGNPCKGPAMRNGRCRMHGGASTGPRTAEGLACAAKAWTTHCKHTAEM